jgi:hypothetical protein
VETQAARVVDLYASLGINRMKNLTSRGVEEYHMTTYSAGLTHRIFSLQASRNSSTGLLNLITSPLLRDPSQLFLTLPLETLLAAPFSTTLTANTSISLATRLRNGLAVQFRYVRQRFLFSAGTGLRVNQYDLFADYRIGKFVFTTGASYVSENPLDPTLRHRVFYFFRMSRPFKIF